MVEKNLRVVRFVSEIWGAELQKFGRINYTKFSPSPGDQSQIFFIR